MIIIALTLNSKYLPDDVTNAGIIYFYRYFTKQYFQRIE